MLSLLKYQCVLIGTSPSVIWHDFLTIANFPISVPQGNQQQWGGPMQQGPMQQGSMQQGPMQQGPNQQRYNTGSPNSMAPTMNNNMSSSSLSQASHMPPMYSRMNTPQHRISPHRPENKQATTTAQSPNTAPPFHSPAKGHVSSHVSTRFVTYNITFEMLGHLIYQQL